MLNISIEKDKINYLHFLENKISQNSCKLTVLFDRAFLEVRDDDGALRGVIKDSIAEIITIGYKYDYFKKYLQIGDDNLLDITLINTMSIFDNTSDKKFVLKRLNYLDEISIDGIFYFKLNELRKKWDEIIGMSIQNRLLSHDCEIKKEFLNYLIQAIPAVTHTIKLDVCENDFTMYDINNKNISKMNYVRNKSEKTVEEEMLYNLICYSPKAVVIRSAPRLSTQFYELLNSFFDFKQGKNS